jgi:hypothetical protein
MHDPQLVLPAFMAAAKRDPRFLFWVECIDGRLEEAKALIAEHGEQIADNFEVVPDAVGVHGHLSIGQWAVTEYGLQHLSGWRATSTFLLACSFGNLHVCRWLVDLDIKLCDQWRPVCRIMELGFECAVTNHRWAVARWLVQGRPEFPWPAKALTEFIAQCWSPSRDVWMRSVTRV